MIKRVESRRLDANGRARGGECPRPQRPAASIRAELSQGPPVVPAARPPIPPRSLRFPPGCLGGTATPRRAACRRAALPRPATGGRTRLRLEKGRHVACVVVQAHDVSERESRRLQHHLQVVERLGELRCHVARVQRRAAGVHRCLAGAVEHARRLAVPSIACENPKLSCHVHGLTFGFEPCVDRRPIPATRR